MFGISWALLYDMNPLLSIALTVSGGMLGVIIYLYLWDIIQPLWEKLFNKKKKPFKINNYRRWLVGFINNYGLFGVAFLTPIILSVPVGTIIAAAIEDNKWKIKRYMLISFLNWSVLFFGLFQLFDINVKELIHRLLF